jgi:biopolymer transport protein ExbB
MGLLETVMRGDALSRSVAALLPLAMSVLSWAVIFYKGWMLRCAARDVQRASAALWQAADWAGAR